MQNHLDTKLSRIETTVGIMKNNLRLADDEVIEKVAEATNLHSLANIYIQENEPENKDGIWIKANPEEVQYDTIKIDADVLLSGYWRYDNTEAYAGFYTYGPNEICYCQGKFYGIRPYTSTSNLEIYEYDFSTTPMTSQKVFSSTSHRIRITSSLSIQPFTDGTYVYIPDGNASGGGVHRFNPVDKTCTFISTMPSTYDTVGSNAPNFSSGCYNAADDSLYVVGPWGGQLASYNCTTKAITSLYYPTSTGPKMRYVYPMGEKLFTIRSKAPYASILDIATKTFTSITTGLENESMLATANIIDMGNYWYAFKALDKVLKINKNDFTYEDVTADFTQGKLNETITTVFHDKDHHFIAITADSAAGKRFVKMDLNTADYDHNSIVIMQSPISKTEKQTALWSYPALEGRMCQSFYDVYYYDKDTKYQFNLPTYYGNGNEWVQFK